VIDPLRRLADWAIDQLASALIIAFVTAIWWEKRR
jgi:hypothetical protein